MRHLISSICTLLLVWIYCVANGQIVLKKEAGTVVVHIDSAALGVVEQIACDGEAWCVLRDNT